MPTAAEVKELLDSPFRYAQKRGTASLNFSRPQRDALQLQGLKQRFSELRDAIPMVKRLADNQDIRRIEQVEDVLPLLFDHQTYKSYPSFLLDEQKFDQLTRWVGKLTTLDLSRVDAAACRGIDDWMMTLNRETPLSLIHTSGTSGTMSFIPTSKREWEKFSEHPLLGAFGDARSLELPLDLDCIYPYYRHGGWSHAAANDAFVKFIAGSEERFHAAYPGRLSSDLLLLATRRRAAQARGEPESVRIPPELESRREEFERQQRDMPRFVENFFETLCKELAGRRVFTQVTAHMLVNTAEKGLKAGRHDIFAPDSVVVTGGGGKGMVLPPDWEETVRRFFGVKHLSMTFGMSEMICVYYRCSHGHYHAPAWNIPFLLDAETDQPLPRKGRNTGRLAFYDLLAETRWGGFITGDYVTFDWDTPCPCGSDAAYIVGRIQRVSDVRKADAGEEKVSCAATPEAYEDALDFLNTPTQ